MRVVWIVGAGVLGSGLGVAIAGCTSILGDFTVSSGQLPEAGSTPDAGHDGATIASDSGADAPPGAGSMLSISPTSFSFPTTPTGMQGSKQIFLVTNKGTGTSAMLTTALTPGSGTASGEFVIASQGCAGTTLGRGRSCAVTVQFDPVSYGAKSASLSINGGPPTATMTGTAEDSLTLNVTKSGTGGGTVTDASNVIDCGTTCTGSYERTTSDPVVTLTATADAASTFSGWSGAGCSGVGTCAVTLSSPTTTVTAAFTSLWTIVKTSSAVGAYVPQLATALGNFVYFGSTTPLFESCNVTSGVFAAEPTLAQFSEAGGGPMMAGTTMLYDFYNGGLSSWTPGATTWTSLHSDTQSIPNGTMGVIGTTVYAFGGTGSNEVFLQVGTSWSASVAAMPVDISNGCTGVDPTAGTAGKFYLFGGNTPANPNMYAYTISSNSWAKVTTATGGPLTCSSMATTTWNGNLVYADSQGVHVFNLTSLTWGTTFPLPAPAPSLPVALGTGTHLYLLGYDGVSTDTVYVWNQ
jgi:hypothetical protein